MSPWLTLQEYSYHKGISISTLRRKIKNEEISYKLKNGRYFLKSDMNDFSQRNSQNDYYKQRLQETEQKLSDLKNNHEDLINLVSYLEMEKKELLQYIENNLTLNSIEKI
ncbi:MAG: hypothetical protein OXC37_05475 [Bdellovibrionaceae bacterium]|nr:hypothetical protein [Pseudobdellovibrionaceae bacterium]